jgi:hypothetical protein
MSERASDDVTRELNNLLRAWDQASWAARRKFLLRVAQVAELVALARPPSDDRRASS